jgi:hypothetical protein
VYGVHPERGELPRRQPVWQQHTPLAHHAARRPRPAGAWRQWVRKNGLLTRLLTAASREFLVRQENENICNWLIDKLKPYMGTSRTTQLS